MKGILTFILIAFSLQLGAQTISTNDSLISKFISEWIGVPYKFGGSTKRGIDCSQLNKNFLSIYKL